MEGNVNQSNYQKKKYLEMLKMRGVPINVPWMEVHSSVVKVIEVLFGDTCMSIFPSVSSKNVKFKCISLKLLFVYE